MIESCTFERNTCSASKYLDYVICIYDGCISMNMMYVYCLFKYMFSDVLTYI